MNGQFLREACAGTHRDLLRVAKAAVLSLLCGHAGTTMAAPLRAEQSREPPRFASNIHIFNPRMPLGEIQATIDRIASEQIGNQFGNQRYALLFEPGSYGSAAHPLIFQVGYYTQVAGLGAYPEDVVIHGAAQVRNQCFKSGCGALDNFWRSLSNLTIRVAGEAGCYSGEIWAVSQAAPMRRVRVLGGDLKLTDTCTRPSYASGGFIADSQFDGQVQNGAQQQFLIRNSEIHGWSNGSWNQVFSGVLGAPPACFPARPQCGPYTTLLISPITREAPFLILDSDKHFNVFVPSVQHNSAGTSWAGHAAPGQWRALTSFYIATPKDTAANLNAALRAGRNLLLSPGVYHLYESIEVSRPDTVVLGLGFATLVPEGGIVPMRISAASGVSLAGLLFDAGETKSPALLTVGDPDVQAADESALPTSLHDVFFRIGGAQRGKATVSLVVNSHHVILDDIWAWRADHGQFVGWNDNTADTGVIVNGDHVTAYGLFVEHYQQYEVLWQGDDGTDIFFQNEMPYDPPDQAAWRESPAVEGWAAFKLGDAVRRFRGYGMGSYCYFNQGKPVYAANAFEVPATLPPSSLQNLFTIYLAGGSGGIRNVINDQGGPHAETNPHAPVTVMSFP